MNVLYTSFNKKRCLSNFVLFLYPNIMSNANFWINYTDKEIKRCYECFDLGTGNNY